MAHQRGRSTSPVKPSRPRSMLDISDDDSILNTKQIEAFGRTVHATASHIIAQNFSSSSDHTPPDAYRKALSSVHNTLRRPIIQRSVFSFAKANPRELIRSNFNTSEIEHRALSYVPDDLLRNTPASSNPFSLFEGFQATLPDDRTLAERLVRRRWVGKGESKDVGALAEPVETGPPQLVRYKREKGRLDHKLEMMGIRKGMCTAEIKEIDSKIENLKTMRQVLVERLSDLEQEEHDIDVEAGELGEKIEIIQEDLEDQAAMTPPPPLDSIPESPTVTQGQDADAMKASFMSESIYERLPNANAREGTKPRRRRPHRRISTPVLHQNLEPGSRIRELQAHNDLVTALDFDAPYGTLVSAALDDTVRVWDLSAGRCMGMLEGHLSSVRCLQVEDNIVATGSMDASIKLWDLAQADYTPVPSQLTAAEMEAALEEADDVFTPATEEPPLAQTQYHSNAMEDCLLFTLSAHVAEVTALHFRDKTLVSGSADKTLRQWDLEKGRCVQTLDVLWAAAQSTSVTTNIDSTPGAGTTKEGGWWRPTSGRIPDAEADFVGALQVFETALACGTADGVIRMWDLRSGMVHRSLIGHTGPITALQFDDHFLVTSSRDRSIRIWDLRTGGIHDAFAYEDPITSMMFDARRIVSAAGESVVKVYDKTDGRHWDCGAGAQSELSSDSNPATVERVRIKDGYLVEGRRDGMIGVWSC